MGRDAWSGIRRGGDSVRDKNCFSIARIQSKDCSWSIPEILANTLVEEHTLRAFFGEAYRAYEVRVPRGVPLVGWFT